MTDKGSVVEMPLFGIAVRRGADRFWLAAFLICLVYIITSRPEFHGQSHAPRGVLHGSGEQTYQGDVDDSSLQAPFQDDVRLPHNVSTTYEMGQPLSPTNSTQSSSTNTTDVEATEMSVSSTATSTATATATSSPEKTAKEAIKALFTEEPEPWDPPGIPDLDQSRMDLVPPYLTAILEPEDTYFDRLLCPSPIKKRYKRLKRPTKLIEKPETTLPRYFFALNLYQCAYVLPRLLGSIVEAMRFLGPEDCVMSIVGGRSDDGTTEILAALKYEIEAMGAKYYFSTSDIDPMQFGHDRVTELAKLRNLVLDPLVRQPHLYALDTMVAFINDVSICVDDILELIYQKVFQEADMVCALDWTADGDLFYDVWISRGINGDLFFEIPQSGSWDFSHNLFWNDPDSQSLYEAKLPFQVYSCWNGAVVFSAEPLILQGVKFRASYDKECYMGEPTLFCKDFWATGYGRIAVIPTVNVGYNDEQSRFVKTKRGYASHTIQHTPEEKSFSTDIKWQTTPPEMVKCEPDWTHPTWVRWDAPQDHAIHDWSHSGYFNAKEDYNIEHPPDFSVLQEMYDREKALMEGGSADWTKNSISEEDKIPDIINAKDDADKSDESKDDKGEDGQDGDLDDESDSSKDSTDKESEDTEKLSNSKDKDKTDKNHDTTKDDTVEDSDESGPDEKPKDRETVKSNTKPKKGEKPLKEETSKKGESVKEKSHPDKDGGSEKDDSSKKDKTNNSKNEDGSKKEQNSKKGDKSDKSEKLKDDDNKKGTDEWDESKNNGKPEDRPNYDNSPRQNEPDDSDTPTKTPNDDDGSKLHKPPKIGGGTEERDDFEDSEESENGKDNDDGSSSDKDESSNKRDG